jgi:hypothetical protein
LCVELLLQRDGRLRQPQAGKHGACDHDRDQSVRAIVGPWETLLTMRVSWAIT